MAAILEQCFDTLKTYGREPESLGNMHKAFLLALEDYKNEDIHGAFIEYLKTSNEIPTPSDIIQIIERNQVYSSPAYKVFDGSDIPDQPRKDPVNWAFKNWNEIENHHDVIVHTGWLAQEKGKDRALDYIKYLQHNCGAPKDLASRIFT